MKKFSVLFFIIGFIISLQVYAQQQDLSDTLSAPENRMARIDNDQDDGTVMQAITPKDEQISFRYFTRERGLLTQSVSRIDAAQQQNIAGANRMNSFAGVLPGIMIRQRGSMPGDEWTQHRVRGINSFGISQQFPLVLLDGVETDISHINPHTLESVTVLKDAAATAMFGLRAASGVILLESKRGQKGPLTVEFHSQGSVVEPMRKPSFLGAYDYARLYNEALFNDGQDLRYDDDALSAFQSGSDPVFHPDIDWMGEYLRDYTFQTRNAVTVSAADEDISYLFAINNTIHTGIFDIDDDVNTYNTNTGFNSTGLQARMSYDAIAGLHVTADLKGRFDVRRTPGQFNNHESRLMGYFYNTPPVAHPVFNPDGSMAGTQDFRNNIYGELHHAGYSEWRRTLISSVVDMDYDMGWLTEGLHAKGHFGYVNYADHITNRSKEFAVFQYMGEDEEGEPQYNQIGQESSMANTSGFDENRRILTAEVGLNYQIALGNDRLQTGLFADYKEESRRIPRLPRVYQALRGYAGYNIDNRYLIDVVGSYMGSEQFPADNRYGIFPAASLGWIISNENFASDWGQINQLKIRTSYGLTGNDFDPYVNNNPYFGYIDNFSPGRGYHFGYNTSWETGFYEVNAANATIIWETVAKFNAGIDANLFDNRFHISADYFFEESKDILILGANEQILGYEFWSPAGIANNQGIDMNLGWADQSGDFSYAVSGMLIYAVNEITEQEEPLLQYPWMQTTGHPINSLFGYTFDRYFTEDDNIDDLPDHSLLGQLGPGSLIYKDLNGDGIIDERDISMIARPDLPEVYFGLNMGAQYRNLDFKLHFQGAVASQNIFSNPYLFEFHQSLGNVDERHLERWVAGSGQQAEYPALSLTNTSINRVNSTYWVKDLHYLRLKSAEVGYTFSGPWISNVGLQNFRIYFSAYNLHTWDNTGRMDPESRAFGTFYPMTRYFSAGLNVVF